MEQLLSPIVNFSVFFALMVFLVRKPLAVFLSERRESLRKEIESAVIAKERADRAYKEAQEKLSQLDSESKKLIEEAKASAESIKNQILASAKASAQRMVEDASQIIQGNAATYKEQIKNEVLTEIFAEAERLLKKDLSPDDRKKIMNESIGKATF